MAFAAASFSSEEDVLRDLSGRGNNATLMSPASAISVRTNTSTLSGQPYTYLQGSSEARILLPNASSTYTLFHVARYSRARRGRILTGMPTDAMYAPFVSGFDSWAVNGSNIVSVARR